MSTNDSVYRHAEQLVRAGHGDAGRALVDTLLASTRPGTSPHGQALYWRASLAADAAEAERGYRRVIIEYPVSRWAGDALLNLAQLELARGDQEQALLHLHRFEREHPGHEARARASLWLARLYFDKKNESRGCAVLATARAGASPEDVELRNQIDYYGQRCMGVDTTATPIPEPPQTDPPKTEASKAETPAPAKQELAKQEPSARETPRHAPPERTAPKAAVARPAAAPPAPLPAPARRTTTSPATTPSKPPVTDSNPRPQTVGGYTVQIAAFDTRRPAKALIERLKVRGYTARLATNSRPFRVRVGRYDTRVEATAAQQRLKAKGIEGFVTEMEQP
jgi:cell division septation protein DedD